MTEIAKQLIIGTPFAMLALGNVHASLKDEVQLDNGTWVLRRVPPMLGDHWARWIGSLRAEKMRNANLVLLTQHRLQDYLARVIFMLRLSGVMEYDDSELISGNVAADGITVTEMGRLPSFRNTKGYFRYPIDLPRIKVAMARTDSLCQIELMLQTGRFERFMRGVNVLKDGLLKEHGQERIHQFVRSLEAVILPDTGSTRRQFIHRCQTLAVANQQSSTTLAESFDMRSDTEHLQNWQRALKGHPAVDRETVALQRTRQMEKLTSLAYARLFDDENLRTHFKDDSAQLKFWKLPDHQRKILWGSQCDFSCDSNGPQE